VDYFGKVKVKHELHYSGNILLFAHQAQQVYYQSYPHKSMKNWCMVYKVNLEMDTHRYCRYPVDRVPMCTRLKRPAPWLQIRSRCQRALALPCALRHRARHPPEKGSGIATCPMAQSAPPARKGIRCHHVPRGTVRATR
jgi:hypothetical protein